MADLPLKNVRVLDFTHLLPGELCSTVLSDLGCTVLRVESLQPGLGQKLPPLVNGESLYYWAVHRNKQRIALNLKDPRAVEIVHKLATEVDIVLENFRPGVMDRLGVGYEALKTSNERLIFCSISGYGQKSQFSQRPGHDLNFIAESGVLGLSRNEEGRPTIPGILVADYMSAQYASIAITAALYQRQQSGTGQHLDVAMFDCALSSINILATFTQYRGEPPEHGRPGFRDELYNYGVYRCKDERYIAVASLEPQFWSIFCERTGKSALASHVPQGTDRAVRGELEKMFMEKTLAEWMQVFENSNCCVSPVNTIEEALAFQSVPERHLLTELAHPKIGKVPQLRSPIFLDVNACDSREASRANVPVSAEETTLEVLKHLNYSQEEIRRMAEDGVLRVPEVIADKSVR